MPQADAMTSRQITRWSSSPGPTGEALQAWAAGSPARVQRPKGFWTDRRRTRSPRIPLRLPKRASWRADHARPAAHAAGLHRLGADTRMQRTLEHACRSRLVSTAISAIPARRGWWTQERTASITAYAETCRRAGVTLSTTALTALGGEACSLKSYAAAHFGTFAAFQRAVVARHPDIRLPSRPIAADGTEMDSWSEVPVYDSLCVALPDARIAVHVILPGQKKDDRATSSSTTASTSRFWALPALRCRHRPVATRRNTQRSGLRRLRSMRRSGSSLW